ncbi:hypothetical protein [Burkholderia sp. Tr-20390]|uniref:hypothetical protein n=1 Tax=Burkholderia sp. Tr-20390 TaxID=2703904 RepID=UPI00197F6B05|nr:hypothetical protein [Burkholderia sp. Tr-20390]
MGLVMSRPAVVMPPPERIAERGRSKPRADLDEMPAWRPVDAASQERYDDRRRSERNARDTDTRRNGHRGKIRHASAEAAGPACGTWLCMSRMIAVRVLVFMLATMRARHRTRRDRVIGACSVPRVRHGHDRPRARHRHSRERLDRQAQRQQHDDEEFAPVRHGCEITQATTGWAGAAPRRRAPGTRRPQLIAAAVTTTWPKHDRHFMTIPSSGGHPSRTHGAVSSRVTLTG